MPVGLGDHLVGLRDGHRQRLLADHVLARAKGLERLGMVQERGRGDVHEVDVVAREHLADILDVRDAEPPGRRQRRFPVRPGHAGQRHARHLGELLQRVQAESAAANHTQSDFTIAHEPPPFPHTERPASVRFDRSILYGTSLPLQGFARIFFNASSSGRYVADGSSLSLASAPRGAGIASLAVGPI